MVVFLNGTRSDSDVEHLAQSSVEGCDHVRLALPDPARRLSLGPPLRAVAVAKAGGSRTEM